MTGPVDQKTIIKENIEIAQSGITLARDLLLLGLLFVLIFNAPWLLNKLHNMGVNDIDAFGLKISTDLENSKKSSLETAKTVNDAMDRIAKSSDALETVKKQNPQLAAALAPIEANLNNTNATLQQADSAVRRSIITQQATIEKVSPDQSAIEGWLYLGPISEDRQGWSGYRSTDAPWPVGAGTTVKVVDDVYVHGDGSPSLRSASPQIGAARRGQSVRIEQVEVGSHLKAGGWVVWARVSVLG
jgi:hypothetical protein